MTNADPSPQPIPQDSALTGQTAEPPDSIAVLPGDVSTDAGVVAGVTPALIRRRKRRIAVSCFAAVVALATSGWLLNGAMMEMPAAALADIGPSTIAPPMPSTAAPNPPSPVTPAPPSAPEVYNLALQTFDGAADAQLPLSRSALTTTVIGEPANGQVSLVDGSIRYVASEGFVGTDQVTYQSCIPSTDLCSTAAVSVEVLPSSLSRFVSAPQPLVDTRGDTQLFAGASVDLGVAPTGATAAILNVTVVGPSAGTVSINGRTILSTGGTTPVLSTLAHVAVQPDQPLTALVGTGGDFVADLVGWYVASDASAEGRFVSVESVEIASLNTATDGRIVTIDPSAHPAIAAGVASAAVLTVRADVGVDGGSVIFADGVSGNPLHRMMWAGSTDTPTRLRYGTAIVPVKADGSIELAYLGGTDISVSVAGYYTSSTAEVSRSGLFVPYPADGTAALELTEVGPRRFAIAIGNEGPIVSNASAVVVGVLVDAKKKGTVISVDAAGDGGIAAAVAANSQAESFFIADAETLPSFELSASTGASVTPSVLGYFFAG